jgi:hypothetical protein
MMAGKDWFSQQQYLQMHPLKSWTEFLTENITTHFTIIPSFLSILLFHLGLWMPLIYLPILAFVLWCCFEDDLEKRYFYLLMGLVVGIFVFASFNGLLFFIFIYLPLYSVFHALISEPKLLIFVFISIFSLVFILKIIKRVKKC